MPFPSHDSLLQVPGIRANLKHLEIVIGLEDNDITAAQSLSNQFCHITQVCNVSNLETFRLKRETKRIHGIVRYGKGRNLEVLEQERLASGDEFQAIAHNPRINCGECLFPDVNRNLSLGKKSRNAIYMVGVLMGDDDRVEIVERLADGVKSLQRLGWVKTCVQQNSNAAGADKSAISGATTAQDGYLHRHYWPTCGNVKPVG